MICVSLKAKTTTIAAKRSRSKCTLLLDTRTSLSAEVQANFQVLTD